ncbi:MAG TPA: hypothetical protein VFB60_11780 [Ktedonobacteraceae bacterium]|nr:hypothetical protein [Ktedonobacteraceae bacterium]
MATTPKPVQDLTDLELKHERKDVKILITALERGNKTMSFTAEGQRCYETLQQAYALLEVIDAEIGRRAIAAFHSKLQEIALPQAKNAWGCHHDSIPHGAK